jgi:hypothetical protein
MLEYRKCIILESAVCIGIGCLHNVMIILGMKTLEDRHCHGQRAVGCDFSIHVKDVDKFVM